MTESHGVSLWDLSGLDDPDRWNRALDRAMDTIDPPPPPETGASVFEDDWRQWLTTVLPGYFPASFAAHHAEFWDHVWSIDVQRPRPLVGIWARGGAKSTSTEAACVALGARRIRRYVLYVSGVQDQADDHVETVGAMLESRDLARWYPEMADRAVGKWGNVKGWRRNRLRTAAGFTIDAMGLDSAARGAKLEEQRPDMIVLDDIDGELDKPGEVARKITILSRRLLPAGAANVTVIAVQNLVHGDSVFARLAGVSDEPIDILARRAVIGPVPAVADMTVTADPAGGYRITGGTPTWAGQDLGVCEAQIADWGLTAFLAEAQHEVGVKPGGMYDHVEFARCPEADVPDLVRTTVWVDPAVTDKDDSDSQGIQADGIDPHGTVFRLRSWEGRTSPLDALCRAIRIALDVRSQTVGVETDQGGDTWGSVFREAQEAVAVGTDLKDPESGDPRARLLRMKDDKAGAGYGPKVHRGAQMLADYERGGRIVHVLGSHLVLERSLKRFPKTKPLDLADAAFWSWHDLTGRGRQPRRRLVPTGTVPRPPITRQSRGMSSTRGARVH